MAYDVEVVKAMVGIKGEDRAIESTKSFSSHVDKGPGLRSGCTVYWAFPVRRGAGNNWSVLSHVSRFRSDGLANRSTLP